MVFGPTHSRQGILCWGSTQPSDTECKLTKYMWMKEFGPSLVSEMKTWLERDSSSISP